jgi:hypothetical protein
VLGDRQDLFGPVALWDYYYYPALEPYAFEFRICLSKRGLDPCGSKLKNKEPPSRPY